MIITTFALLCAAQPTQQPLMDFVINTSGDNLRMEQKGGWLARWSPFTDDLGWPMLQLYRRGAHGWEVTDERTQPAFLSELDMIGSRVTIYPPFVFAGFRRRNQFSGGIWTVRFDDQGQLGPGWFTESQDAGMHLGTAIEAGPGGELISGEDTADGWGMVYTGRVAVYRVVGNTLVRTQTVEPRQVDVRFPALLFGAGVRLDGDMLGVHARDLARSGSVHIFERDGQGLFQHVQTIRDPVLRIHDYFGIGMAFEGDVLVVGKRGPLGAHGRAYVYRRDPVTRLYGRETELRPSVEIGTGSAGNKFGLAVEIEHGTIVIGAPSHDSEGRLFVYEPRPDGTYSQAESWSIPSPHGQESALFGTLLDLEDGLISVRASAARGRTPSGYMYSIGPEVDICSGTFPGVETAPYLDTWFDSEAPVAANGLPRRGLVLSSVPPLTRFVALVSLRPDATASGVLLGSAGLCLRPPFVRMGFGVAGGEQELALIAANALSPAADRLLTVSGTVYCQAFCAPPLGAPTGNGWTNAIELEIGEL